MTLFFCPRGASRPRLWSRGLHQCFSIIVSIRPVDLHNTGLRETVKETELKYFRKSVSLQKDIIEGMMSRARGKPKMNWMNNVTSRTGLTIDGAIRTAADREVWRKDVYIYIYDATNRRIEDG